MKTNNTLYLNIIKTEKYDNCQKLTIQMTQNKQTTTERISFSHQDIKNKNWINKTEQYYQQQNPNQPKPTTVAITYPTKTEDKP